VVSFTPQPLSTRFPLVDPRGGPDDMEKLEILALRYSISDPLVVQPVASRYTDGDAAFLDIDDRVIL
jgi:hypothetical protein